MSFLTRWFQGEEEEQRERLTERQHFRLHYCTLQFTEQVIIFEWTFHIRVNSHSTLNKIPTFTITSHSQQHERFTQILHVQLTSSSFPSSAIFWRISLWSNGCDWRRSHIFWAAERFAIFLDLPVPTSRYFSTMQAIVNIRSWGKPTSISTS